MQHFAMRKQGRDDAANMQEGSGWYLRMKVDDSGACGGDPDLVWFRAHERKDGGGDLLRAEGGFRDGEEAEFLESVNQLAGTDAGILGDEGRGERDDDCALAVDEGFGAGQIVADLLGVVGTGKRAVAAEDAEFGNDTRIIVLNADGFYGAFADAFIAILTFVLLVFM